MNYNINNEIVYNKPLDILASFIPRNRDEEWAKRVVLRHRAKMTTRAIHDAIRREVNMYWRAVL